MIDTAARSVFDEELNLFRDQVRKFYDKALTPNLDRWEAEGIVDRRFWLACGEAGMLCPTVSPEYGGLGLDFGYNAVVARGAVLRGLVGRLHAAVRHRRRLHRQLRLRGAEAANGCRRWSRARRSPPSR